MLILLVRVIIVYKINIYGHNTYKLMKCHFKVFNLSESISIFLLKFY